MIITLSVGMAILFVVSIAMVVFVAKGKKAMDRRDSHYQAFADFSRSAETCDNFDDILRMTAELGNRLFGLIPTFFVQKAEGKFAGFEYSNSKAFELESKFHSFLRWIAQNDRIYWRRSKKQNWLGSMKVSAQELSSQYGSELLMPFSEGDKLLALMGWKGDVKSEHVPPMNSLKLRASAALAKIRLQEESENLTYLAQELDLAASVELAMIPQSLEGKNKHLSWQGFYQPVGRRGSDFWGVYPMSEGVTYLVMGDAVDKGLAGTMVSGLLKSCVRQLLKSKQCIGLDELLSILNRCLFKETSPALASCFVGIIDTHRNTFTYSGAGFPSPYLIRGGNGSIEALMSKGAYLGDGYNFISQVKEKTFGSGDALFVTTNGLASLRNRLGKPFGERRVISTLKEALAQPVLNIPDVFSKRLSRFRSSQKLKDDVALLALCRDNKEQA